jgi:hypothetical protein
MVVSDEEMSDVQSLSPKRQRDDDEMEVEESRPVQRRSQRAAAKKAAGALIESTRKGKKPQKGECFFWLLEF